LKREVDERALDILETRRACEDRLVFFEGGVSPALERGQVPDLVIWYPWKHRLVDGRVGSRPVSPDALVHPFDHRILNQLTQNCILPQRGTDVAVVGGAGFGSRGGRREEAEVLLPEGEAELLDGLVDGTRDAIHRRHDPVSIIG